MRRTEREVLDVEFMHQVLRDAGELFIALNTGGAPYILAVNHVLRDGCIFFHCATEGRKLDLMEKDARIGFFTAADIRVEGTTTRYRSVSGTGVASLVDDVLKDEVLRALAARFRAPCVFPISPEKLAATSVVRLTIETITGKHSRPGEPPRPMKHHQS